MPLVVIVGPTAVGKTDLSLALAEMLQTEIVSGDSMQVYRGMDIGTGKVSREIRERIPHHLIDIVDPDEPYSVAQFQRDATEKIREIHDKNLIPILVGGTGLYIRSVTHLYQFVPAPEDPSFRQEMKQFLQEKGKEALHERLMQVDPVTARRLHPNDTRRVIRALEIHHLTGLPFSRWQHKQQQQPSPYRLLTIGLTMERQALYRRIHLRIDGMMEAGLADEVACLLEKGYSPSLPSMQGLGYKEIIPYVLGQCSREEAVQEFKKRTRQFAKRQLTWFTRQHEAQWITLEPDGPIDWHNLGQRIAGKVLSLGEYT